jgi:ABC-2 type transport system permease protein
MANTRSVYWRCWPQRCSITRYINWVFGGLILTAAIGSYLGLALLAAVFAAIGILAGPHARPQIIAFRPWWGCFLIYSFRFVGSGAAQLGLLRQSTGNQAHYRDLSKGPVDRGT